MTNKTSMTLSFLGGVGEVGKNITALEYNDEILIIDCGLTFPTDDMPGIDVVIPDDTYLSLNKHKIKAFLITHGHEDHIGALPYFLDKFNVPIYGSKLTLALIENKLKERHKNGCKLIAVKPGTVVKIGGFSVEFLKMTHSVSGAMAFCITTAVGSYFHTGDFKIDLSPLDGEGIDFVRLGEISKRKVLLMTSDSTNAQREGFSMSEKSVGLALENLFNQNKNKRILVATFSSNIHRVQQILNISEKCGRKVAFSGRSMVNVCETAARIGELSYNPNNIIDIKTIDKYEDKELCIITTGTQGEERSALTRMALGEFSKVEIGENDLIIFSSSAIPGNERAINRVINQLYKLGASVVNDEVHVTGHAYQQELKMMLNLIKPKFFIPCHGEYRHLRAHADLAVEVGIPERNIIIPELGNKIAISKNSIKVQDNVPAGAILVDGAGMGEVDSNVIKERTQLSREGICIITLTISQSTGTFSSEPNIMARGFLYDQEKFKEIIEDVKSFVLSSITNINFKMQDWTLVKLNLKKAVSTYFLKKYKSRPVVLPIIIETI